MNPKPGRIFTREVGYTVLVAELAVLIYLLLPPSLFHSFHCESKSTRLNNEASNGIFIARQVVVIGSPNDLDAVITTATPAAPVTPQTQIVPTTPVTPPTSPTPVVSTGGTNATNKVTLDLIEDCDLSYLNTRKAPDSNTVVEQRKRVLRLYEIPQAIAASGLTVESVINQINGARTANEVQRDIFAELNYRAGLLESTRDICYLPTGGGSGGGGRDFGDPGILDPGRYPNEKFTDQWAFRSQGINFDSLNGFTGHEVQVGVMDTSPYRTSFPFIRRIGIALPSPLWIKTRNALDIPPKDPSSRPITRNHGLFVAGLIHRIAPQSSIELIRVLDDDGCGQSFIVAKALHAYTSRESAWTGDLDEHVINMSLGFYIPNDQEQLKNTTSNWNMMKDKDGKLHSYALEDAITKANDLGAIIVAAAGNDSSYPDLPRKEMLVPAKYANVIGVAATNTKGELACFSNEGDVSAPGGEGGATTRKKPDGTPESLACGPRGDSWDQPVGPYHGPECTDPANCTYGLISLGLTEEGARYLYWSGTSFSTPLVSGLAALAYEERSKKQVECLIQKGASGLVGVSTSDPNWGIIDITDSLSSDLITQCETEWPSSE